ncbi:MAG: glycosyltransferase family 2 protein [Parvularculaceae bacterium]
MTERHRLPSGYVCQSDAAPYLDVPSGITYQPDVYSFAAYLAERATARRIVDIGCGAATKLASINRRIETVCIDNAESLELARTNVPGATFIAADLERGLLELNDALFDDAVVICADVLEHLHNPDVVARRLASLASRSPYMLLSTPDRDRARGLLNGGPPDNRAHIREWNADEFGRFLHDCGFCSPLIIGHTVNNNIVLAKATTLVVAGREALPAQIRKRRVVAAVMHAFNEADIIRETVTHLRSQGVEVHAFDNWSDDGTYESLKQMQAEGLCATVLRFPDQASEHFELRSQLEFTAEFSCSLNADWIIHHDADEFRYSPWHGVPLCDAITFADSLGYNALDFTVLDFRFLQTRPDFDGRFESQLTHFEFGRRPGHLKQIKAWKNSKPLVNLADSGGHSAEFPGRRIYPLKFLLKHYPLRSRDQAKRKIFRDRERRIAKERALHGWHAHYDAIIEQGSIPEWYEHNLTPWHRPMFEDEFVVERLSGIGLSRA